MAMLQQQVPDPLRQRLQGIQQQRTQAGYGGATVPGVTAPGAAQKVKAPAATAPMPTAQVGASMTQQPMQTAPYGGALRRARSMTSSYSPEGYSQVPYNPISSQLAVPAMPGKAPDGSPTVPPVPNKPPTEDGKKIPPPPTAGTGPQYPSWTNPKDMRGEIIADKTPWQDLAPTDMNRVREMLEQARQRGTGYQDSAESGRARELGMQGLESVMNGPDRMAMIDRAMSLAREKDQPAFDESVRNVGKSAAAFGRVGSGLVNRNLADLSTEREKNYSQMREGLTIDALDKTMSDRQGQLSAALGAGGQFRNEDLASAGQRMQEGQFIGDLAGREQNIGQVTRSEMESERLGRQQYDSSQRDERRGERDWQNKMQQQSLSDYEREQLLGNQLADSEANRMNQYRQFLMQARYAPQAFGGQSATPASYADLYDLYGEWAKPKPQG